MTVEAIAARGKRAAIDIGGTFTDFASYDAGTKSVRFEKTLSTPARLADGVSTCFGLGEVDLATLQQFIHGSTVAINAVIQKTGARTALVTTTGFTDIYEIARANRPDTYNLFFVKPEPLVAADLRFGVAERLDAGGRVLTSLTETEIKRVVSALVDAGVEAVAVCLLHSYANPAHEIRLGKALRHALPRVYVTLSHEVLREYREYERTSTTVLNAYVGREVTHYINDLEQTLGAQRFGGRFLVMQSNGGVMTARRARQMPVAMMESGPAGGIIGAAELGRAIGFADVIAFDMGGTTAKTCLIEDGQPKMTDQYYIGGYRDGYPMRLPAVDIIEVGAGGGSIAWIDAGGGLHVGPKSAGASPGPACYGLGGSEPTVTDANLIAGRLNPTRFLGGDFVLDAAAAQRAIAARIGAPLKLGALEAAHGIIRLVDSHMAFAVNAITLQRGYDPRRFAMVAFGGAGPLHAMAIARELRIPTVVIPPQPGHFSALGMLMTDLRADFVLTRVREFAALDTATLDQWFAELEDAGMREIRAEGLSREAVVCVRSLDMRYLGQEYTVNVIVPETRDRKAAMADTRKRFDDAYAMRYSHNSLGHPAQVVNIRVTVLGQVKKPDFGALRDKPMRSAEAATSREVYFASDGMVECKVLQRTDIVPGQVIQGPAIIEEYASTTVMHPGDTAVPGAAGCLIVTIGT